MDCKYFGKCGSCTLFSGLNEQRELKLARSRAIFGEQNFEWHSSEAAHYRSRAEFMIWHENEQISYAMHRADKKGKLLIEECPKTDEKISALMPKLLEFIAPREVLRKNLFGVEFLSARDETLVSLLYHKKLDEVWEADAKGCAKALNIKIIGRSKGVKIALGGDFVIEHLTADRAYKYKIYEGAFSQPNRSMNEQMISWVCECVKKAQRRDLLELYCGHGNFTIPLSFAFDKVLSTEISKASINAARENCAMNGVLNIEFARLSSEELTSALDKEREFRRLEAIELDRYDFSHVLVDPPRSGLDSKSCAFLKRFDNIIYISCSQESLKRDLDELLKTHEISRFALFDQFPYTRHIESGVILRKKDRDV